MQHRPVLLGRRQGCGRGRGRGPCRGAAYSPAGCTGRGCGCLAGGSSTSRDAAGAGALAPHNRLTQAEERAGSHLFPKGIRAVPSIASCFPSSPALNAPSPTKPEHRGLSWSLGPAWSRSASRQGSSCSLRSSWREIQLRRALGKEPLHNSHLPCPWGGSTGAGWERSPQPQLCSQSLLPRPTTQLMGSPAMALHSGNYPCFPQQRRGFSSVPVQGHTAAFPLTQPAGIPAAAAGSRPSHPLLGAPHVRLIQGRWQRRTPGPCMLLSAAERDGQTQQPPVGSGSAQRCTWVPTSSSSGTSSDSLCRSNNSRSGLEPASFWVFRAFSPARGQPGQSCTTAVSPGHSCSWGLSPSCPQ